jgi:CheY-like chemotaxis protein
MVEARGGPYTQTMNLGARPSGRFALRKGTELLVVDDDDELRALLADTLKGRGFSVVTAGNGREALGRLRSAPLPAAVLLDLNMPIMNGWQFCAAKNADGALRALPVIVLSAAAKTDPASPYYLDVDEVVTKPIEIEELLSAIERLLGRPRARTR